MAHNLRNEGVEPSETPSRVCLESAIEESPRLARERTQMKLITMLLFAVACSFSGEIDPNIECTKSCEEQEEVCVTDCKQECVDAGGEDTDSACDEDCDTTCTEAYDECSFSCTEAD